LGVPDNVPDNAPDNANNDNSFPIAVKGIFDIFKNLTIKIYLVKNKRWLIEVTKRIYLISTHALVGVLIIAKAKSFSQKKTYQINHLEVKI